MDTRLCFNSTDRLYEVRLGVRVLSSHSRKEDALLSQLAGEAPQALALAQSLIVAHPELRDRALRAVALVADGAVQVDGGVGRYHVRSQQKGKQDHYDIDLNASSCTCTDFEQRAPEINGRKLCKHVLAALFVRKLGPLARKQPIRTEVMFHDRP